MLFTYAFENRIWFLLLVTSLNLIFHTLHLFEIRTSHFSHHSKANIPIYTNLKNRTSRFSHNSKLSIALFTNFKIYLATSMMVLVTFPKDPLPSTMRKLKSDALMMSLLAMLCGTSLSAPMVAFLLMEVLRICVFNCARSAPSSGTGTL